MRTQRRHRVGAIGAAHGRDERARRGSVQSQQAAQEGWWTRRGGTDGTGAEGGRHVGRSRRRRTGWSMVGAQGCTWRACRAGALDSCAGGTGADAQVARGWHVGGARGWRGGGRGGARGRCRARSGHSGSASGHGGSGMGNVGNNSDVGDSRGGDLCGYVGVIEARGGGSSDDRCRCITGACGGGGNGGDGGGGSPSSIFLEQSLKREFTPFFLQMTERVSGGGIPSPLIEPKVGREEKGPTCGPRPESQT